MIGRAPAMQDLFDTIRRLAPHVRTVLVSGETGTGKELVARALHAAGPRAGQKILLVNCSAVAETLLERDLAQHAGGTIFLDEAGDLPVALQDRLLGVVDERNFCVIAATNRNLVADAGKGRFSHALLRCLSSIEIVVPPLRQRREDIPCLTASFIREFSSRLQRPITGITTAAERQLQDAPWPGNVRQLRNVIDRACILADGRILTETDVVAALGSRTQPVAEMPRESDGPKLLSDVQREQIQRVLTEVGGNKAAAARLLGVSRRALYRWIERLDIQVMT